MKELKDYIHYYRNVEVEYSSLYKNYKEYEKKRSEDFFVDDEKLKKEYSVRRIGKLRSIIYRKNYTVFHIGNRTFKSYISFDLSDLKLILRPLNDISDIEKTEFNEKFSYHIKDLSNLNLMRNLYNIEIASPVFQWLLDKNFDIFGLIEEGLAIEKL